MATLDAEQDVVGPRRGRCSPRSPSEPRLATLGLPGLLERQVEHPWGYSEAVVRRRCRQLVFLLVGQTDVDVGGLANGLAQLGAPPLACRHVTLVRTDNSSVNPLDQ